MSAPCREQARSERLSAPCRLQATAAYTALGTTADLARVDNLAQQLGLTKPRVVGRRGYGGRLSPRERQVAELLAADATDRDITDVLFLSPRTVEHHVASVLRKLETTRRNVGAKLSRDETAD